MGSGEAFYQGGRVNLSITGTTIGSALSIKAKGGSGSLTLGDVSVGGALGGVKAVGVDLAGTFYIAGDAGKLSFTTLTGTLAAAGSIASLTVLADMTGAKVLAGTNLGADAQLGGLGAAADTIAPASIAALKVGGKVTTSLIAAALNPIDGTYLNGNDQVIGGATSTIGPITIRGGVDLATRFIAGAFGKPRLPAKTNPLTDPHFQT